jgi:hypothetical protein
MMTDENGKFMLGLKPNGSYLILLKHPQHQDGRFEFKATSDALMALNLSMTARKVPGK